MEDSNNIPINNFDFDITLIAEFFEGLDRQGPGGDEQTLGALSFMRDQLPANCAIADLGCGTGRATATIASALDCHITAIDLLPQMIEGLKTRIAERQLQSKITPRLGSMADLTFADESLDVIWSEGAIYNIGFERGLGEWRRYLKTGGLVAVTDCCWLSDRRPADTKWFTDNFTEIDTVANKLAILQHAGYEPVAAFVLPRHCWTTNYYEPMAVRLEEFERLYADNQSAAMLCHQLRTEIDYYNRLGDLYGYLFFVGRKL